MQGLGKLLSIQCVELGMIINANSTPHACVVSAFRFFHHHTTGFRGSLFLTVILVYRKWQHCVCSHGQPCFLPACYQEPPWQASISSVCLHVCVCMSDTSTGRLVLDRSEALTVKFVDSSMQSRIRIDEAKMVRLRLPPCLLNDDWS